MTLAWPQSVIAGLVGAFLAYAVEQPPPAPSPTPTMSAEEAVRSAREEWRLFRETYEPALNASGDRYIDKMTAALKLVEEQAARDSAARVATPRPIARATPPLPAHAVAPPAPTAIPETAPKSGGLIPDLLNGWVFHRTD